MEGVGLAMGKDVAIFRERGLNVKKILSVGGGTRNELWNQIKANVTRSPLELSDEPEAGLKGAALLATAGIGLIDDLAAAAIERRAAARAVQPDTNTFQAYDAAQVEFIRVYNHMLGFWMEK